MSGASPVPRDGRADPVPAVAGGIAVVAGCTVLLFHYFLPWLLTWWWLLAPVLLAALWLLLVAAVATVLVGAVRRGRWWRAALVAALAAALVGTVIVVDWRATFARSWFALHHDGFAEAASLARAGTLPDLGSYYGAELPGSLGWLSVDGRISVNGETAAGPVLFVPAYEGIPDDAFGFVHLLGPVPPDLHLDGYGDPIRPSFPLGDGWWWAD